MIETPWDPWDGAPGHHIWLVVTGTWLDDMTFPSSWEWNVIIPTDELTHKP